MEHIQQWGEQLGGLLVHLQATTKIIYSQRLFFVTHQQISPSIKK
jgi:hypothetical protein